MRETYLDLPSRLEDAFPEIDNDIMMELRNENEEYLELLQKISDLKQQAPFLTDLLESSGEIRLTAEEHTAFTQYLHLVRPSMFSNKTNSFSAISSISGKG